jgi:hypothetical protein
MRGSPTRLTTTIGLVAVTLLASACIEVTPRQHSSARFSDPTLAERADAICAATNDELASRPPLSSSPSFEERAQRVEGLADTYERMAEELRALEPAGRDAGFDRYLTTWESFIAAGRRYADAIRTGDPRVYQPAGNQADAPNRELDEIARVNGMTACTALN